MVSKLGMWGSSGKLISKNDIYFFKVLLQSRYVMLKDDSDLVNIFLKYTSIQGQKVNKTWN